MKQLLIITLSLLLFGACQNSTVKETATSIAVPDSLVGTFWDHNLEIGKRVDLLIAQLSVEEKIAQLNYQAPAIPRLGIVEYNWWSEACHGIARNGNATVFPQPIAMAASFDSTLIYRVADAISTEARAKFNEAQRIGNRGIYAGITFWAPNVNLFRDPRWGRGMETFGEDPFLTSKLGVSFVKGMQGEDPNHLKTSACAKHYVVHSGPEAERHTFNALPSKKDFYESYTPQFKALVQEGDVESVMCAYNRTYNEPCCGSSYLMQDVLRDEFGFKGHIVSDCWAVTDFYNGHFTDPDVVHAAATALKAGVNLNCGNEFPHLNEALTQGLVTEAEIDEALRYLLPTRFKLGLFDVPGVCVYDAIGTEVVNCAEHQELALEAAHKSMVLLKNENVLPLKKDIRSIYLLGPYAASVEVMLGNYYGISNTMTTVMEGVLNKVSPGTRVDWRPATLPDHASTNPFDWAGDEAVNCDYILCVFGISNMFEGEEGETLSSTTKGDRLDLNLPEHQKDYLLKLRAKSNKPIILVLTGGSPICSPEIYDLADAVIYAWYPGQAGGQAVADVIFGDYNPSGRLPLTFPKSTEQLPDYGDYSMDERTYRYMNEDPLYPFGYGASFTSFEYSDITLSSEQMTAEGITVTTTVSNTGEHEGDEVIQLYISALETKLVAPNYSLKGFSRVALAAGESKEVSFTVTPEMLTLFDADGGETIEEGKYKITVAGASPMPISKKLGVPMVESTITL